MSEITIEIPNEMAAELEDALPDYYPAEVWAANQLVPAIVHLVEGIDQQAAAHDDGAGIGDEILNEDILDGLAAQTLSELEADSE